eukprot:CAMPEP_0116899818 /NCGR_PEP_ID=MMETSP0467-20121206/8306_1 /TAXON_ID=283647 /ORGANISM="Mesodinium pulex, Strain SPMC105" /LENGTH=45 /DNA_ID= /DNA_START= /DNA_END= /DNA_ORIENTATION=
MNTMNTTYNNNQSYSEKSESDLFCESLSDHQSIQSEQDFNEDLFK